jgi:methylmalonyl-CoA/ethylmalonyl-CoA epimerase
VKLNFHHIGIAVNSLTESRENYKALFGEKSISPVYNISSQQVKVCFVDMGNGSFLELVEPTTDESSIHRLRKKGITYYHTAYKVLDIEATVDELTVLNYKAFEYFNSEAFNGKRCIFLFSPDAHLIELIEE